MNITSAIDQLGVLYTLVGSFKTYLEGVKTAATYSDVEGKTTGTDDTLHDAQTWYGVSGVIVEQINQAKDIIANCKSIVVGTLD